MYVDGKLEGQQGHIVDISYNFKIKISDYKKVVAVVDTNVHAIEKDTLDLVVVKMIAVGRILGKMPLLVIDLDQEGETEYDLTHLQEMASPS